MPRSGETRRALRILLASRRQTATHLTASKNTLIALLRGLSLGVDARAPLTLTQYRTITVWRTKKDDRSVDAIARVEAKRIAKQVVDLTDALANNKQLLDELVTTIAPGLLDEPGVGPVTAAQVICSYSHKGRIRSAAAFAALAGTTPIPASSGNTVHYRLNRYGDRQLNHALHTIVMARMRSDAQTAQYVEKRTQSGLGSRDIKRALKRYVARSLFKQLEALNIMA
jgi:transposase